MSQRIVVIMAGGAGERFWPVSRRNFPKQLLALTGDKTMLTLSVERAAGLVGLENIYILTNVGLRQPIIDALPDLPEQNVIGEPVSRNTAACLGLALAHTGFEKDAPTMGVLTADHLIGDLDRFNADVNSAFSMAEKGTDLITFGIPPDRPETGYGYIELGKKLKESSDAEVYKLERFHEKPAGETAMLYLQAGNMVWNSGMFFWNNAALFAAFEKHMPPLADAIRKMRQGILDSNGPAVIAEQFQPLKSISIDRGVMEHADNIKCIRATFNWDDVGSWDALERLDGSDENGNAIVGKNIAVETENCLIYRRDEASPMIAALGIHDLIVVSTLDAILVCRKSDAQGVKKIVQILKDQGQDSLL